MESQPELAPGHFAVEADEESQMQEDQEFQESVIVVPMESQPEPAPEHSEALEESQMQEGPEEEVQYQIYNPGSPPQAKKYGKRKYMYEPFEESQIQ